QNRAPGRPIWRPPRYQTKAACAWQPQSPRACRSRSCSGYRTPPASFVGNRDELFELCRRRAAVERLYAERNTFLQILGAAGDDQRSRSVQQRDVAIGAGLALEHAAKRRRIGIGIAALERSKAAAGKPGIFRAHFESADIAVLERRNRGRAGEGDLVEPVG